MRWLLDEMLPSAASTALGRLGHDARTAREAGLGGAPDPEVLEAAVREDRVLVTENVADFARLVTDRLARGEPCVPIVFVCRAQLPAGRALSEHLARLLDAWATSNTDPYVGPHWPER